MKWIKDDITIKQPIKSWCKSLEDGAMEQAINLANHPKINMPIALMPDAHQGYGMPIGGVIATEDVIIPNAVGVDIGCGMAAVETDFDVERINKNKIRNILEQIKLNVPVGEGRSHNTEQDWQGFEKYLDTFEKINEADKKGMPGWYNTKGWSLGLKSLGTLGGGNHFIEMQEDENGKLWLMLHSGSRNIGYKIAAFYFEQAKLVNKSILNDLPDVNLAYLYTDSDEGLAYIRDMNFAMEYALENRKRMMDVFKSTVLEILGDMLFIREENIHHNYASKEKHFGKDAWVHRKGATSAKTGQTGIIPGSMGTSSYIVEGLGNPESYSSCSHGAGRKMGRMQACRSLSVEECDKAMGNVVYDRWNKLQKWGRKNRDNLMDLGESPLAYKDIDEVIEAQLDLIKPLVKLKPIGVIKG